MQPLADLRFGFVAAAAGAPGTSDRQEYGDLIDDCELAGSLGYDTAWVIEHHFSDYFPTPDPIGLLHFIAARFPRLHLGTCVIVTPWYHPLRLAGSIAQLNTFTDRELHLGLGRGTAKYEYDALAIDMEESRERFEDSVALIRQGLAGRRFTYAGKTFSVSTPVEVRPRSDGSKVHLYGAIGSPSSASIMAQLQLPPMCTAMGDLAAQRNTLTTWKESVGPGLEGSAHFPVMVNCIIEDSDEEAVRQAQEYIPRYMQAQIDHYAAEKTQWQNTKSYEAWERIFAGMKSRCDPAGIPPWTLGQFVGSVATVKQRLQEFAACGFDMFIIHSSTPGTPASVRRRWLTRFAEEVMPAEARRVPQS